ALWFGWVGASRESLARAAGSLANWPRDPSVVPIPLTEAEIASFYQQYCNSVLWPVLHGWADQSLPEPEDWTTYREINERYAAHVLRHVRPDDCVWVHDYHLMLVPQLVRAQRPDARIAFFLHTPFPRPEIFAAIPQSQVLLEGALGADTIGFHTSEYAQNFLDAVQAQLELPTEIDGLQLGARRVAVRAGPMGIDATSFSRRATDPDILLEVDRIRVNAGMALLLGVDRLDYTKGIPQRLLGFERLLELHPRLRGRVTLTQIAVPSREQVGAYRDLREHVESLVERINGSYGRPGWTPVNYLYGTVDPDTLVALYRAADVMLVTSLRDGLNLVAKEFVASRADGDGVLVLSEFAGAATELASALLVNPNRVGQLADVYHQALTMPRAERRSRMRSLREAVESNNVFQWAAQFIDVLPVLSPT
ncbi:MAG: alpha,alpha-trehalose-phosphate synthase (UDP-forming), partial [Longimicrobiales bacterium]